MGIGWIFKDGIKSTLNELDRLPDSEHPQMQLLQYLELKKALCCLDNAVRTQREFFSRGVFRLMRNEESLNDEK